MTSRELVYKTLSFENTNQRAPRDLWSLDWARIHHGEALKDIMTRYPGDISGVRVIYHEKSPVEKGHSTELGEYVDPWGCRFTNIQRGVIGEVKAPIVLGEEWEDADKVHIPEEQLSFDVAQVNAECAKSDKFISCGACPRPFEQLQFIRGTAPLYMDLMDPSPGFLAFLEKMHDFYCRLLRKWAETDVDTLNFMDDWGSQRALLISPAKWREFFAPMYKDYIDIAHKAGKKIFMHSDGYTLEILPDLIDMGLDAINTQLFCMDFKDLAQFKGKITFWGEICRQHLLPFASVAEVEAAVEQVYDALWDNGGCIAQCEFGAGARPENVEAVFRTWDRLTGK
ncbi:MAG: methyltransferase [Clostridia bacterium]|nr:methyltransferase [Clostridia bacterium]